MKVCRISELNPQDFAGSYPYRHKLVRFHIDKDSVLYVSVVYGLAWISSIVYEVLGLAIAPNIKQNKIVKLLYIMCISERSLKAWKFVTYKDASSP